MGKREWLCHGVELPACQARDQEIKTEKKIEEKLAAQQAQRKKREEEKQKKQQQKDAEQKAKEEKAAQAAVANDGDTKPDGSDAAAGNRRRRKRHTGDDMQATDPIVLRESCNFDAATYDFDKCADVNEFAKAVATAPLVPHICRLKRGMLKKVLQAGCSYHES